MALTLTLNADNPDDLFRMLRALNHSLGAPPGQVSDKIASIDFGAVPGGGPLMADVALAPPAPPVAPPDPPKAADPEPAPTPAVNVAVPPDAMTPAEMRQKGSDLLIQFFHRDPAAAQPHLIAIQTRFGVKKFETVPDDRAQEFYQEAVLASNGTGAVAAS